MSVVALSDPAAVSTVLAAWASDHFGVQVRASECTRVSGGRDNFVYFTRLAGSGLSPEWRVPMVLRIRPTADRAPDAQRECAVQRWLSASGYPVPPIRQEFDQELFGVPAQLMVRADGGPMLDLLTQRPWRAQRVIRRLATLHLRLQRLSTEGWPGTVGKLAEPRLRRVHEELAFRHDAALATALSRVERLDLTVDEERQVVCHGDFHPLNIVSTWDADCVVDWTDATLDDPVGDVARTTLLFGFASMGASNAAARMVLDRVGPFLGARYRAAYVAGAGDLVPADFARRHASWECLHLINGWAQIAGLESGSITSSDGNLPSTLLPLVQQRLSTRLDSLD